MDDKAIVSVEIKSDARREVSAVIATFNRVDLDGDYTVPGAFAAGRTGDVLISSFGHDVILLNARPVGKGRIRESGTEAIFEGSYFDTAAGRDAFETIKSLGNSEWSYGLKIKQSEPGTVDGQSCRVLRAVYAREVSPVVFGAAGPGNTRTLATSAKDDVAARIAANEIAQARLLARIHHAQQEQARRELLELRDTLTRNGVI